MFYLLGGTGGCGAELLEDSGELAGKGVKFVQGLLEGVRICGQRETFEKGFAERR